MRIYDNLCLPSLNSIVLALSLGVSGYYVIAPVEAATQIASWNTLHLGWGNGKDIRAMARIGGAFDLIALQEVMSPAGLNTLEAELESVTGESWSSMASDAIGRGDYKEHYAFVWRDSEVAWIDGAVVYIDDRDAFAREPMSARFETADGYTFVLASVHSIYGDDVEGRAVEADALAGYHAWLTESFPGTPVYIAGDFNLAPDNAAWAPLRAVARPLITEGTTTLSSINGKFKNLYDNIWAPTGFPIPVIGAGIMDFPSALGIDHETAREVISDHAPVYMTLDPGSAWITLSGQADRIGYKYGASGAGSASKVTEGYPGEIRGNRKSMVFHRPDCPGYAKLSAKNIVSFPGAAEAIEAGYRVAGNCP